MENISINVNGSNIAANSQLINTDNSNGSDKGAAKASVLGSLANGVCIESSKSSKSDNNGTGAYTQKGEQENDKTSLASKENSEVIEDIKDRANAMQLSLKGVFAKLDGSTAVAVDESGYDVTGSDVKQCVGVIERIKIKLATYCDDYNPALDNVGMDQIKAVVGDSGMAVKVSEAMSKASSLKPIDNNAKVYMAENELEPTIDNLFKASFSTQNMDTTQSVNSDTYDVWNQLKGQLDNIFSNNGIDNTQEHIDIAKELFDNQLPINADNIELMKELDSLELDNMNDADNMLDTFNKIMDTVFEGGQPGDTLLLNRKTDMRQVIDTIKLLSSNDGNLELDKSLDLQTAIDNAKQLDEELEANDNTYIRLQEIRIHMTAEAGLSITKNGINLETITVGQMESELKALTDEDYNLDEVNKALDNIKYAPVEVIGSVDWSEKVTLNVLSVNSVNMTKALDNAKRTYETVGTQIRADLGDRITDALKNSTDSMLEGLGLDKTQANKDAVRILAYNNMDVTNENIDIIKQAYQKVQNLIENAKPQAVMNMIKANVNPMDTDISELTKYLVENEGDGALDSYSEFLYKLDKKQELTTEERKQYIGIYKMINVFTKDAGRAVGALVKQGSELNMENLMSAYVSRKNSQIYNSDFNFEQNKKIEGYVDYYTALFEKTENKLTPDTMIDAAAIKDSMLYGIEEYCETIANVYDADREAESINEYYREMLSKTSNQQAAVEYLIKNEQTVSINNIIAAADILNGDMLKKNKRTNDEESSTDSVLEEVEILEQSDEKNNAKIEQILAETGLDTTYKEIEKLRNEKIELKLYQNLLDKGTVTIPMEIEGRDTMVNVSFQSNSEIGSNVTVSMKTQSYGEVRITAEFEVDMVNQEDIVNQENADNQQQIKVRGFCNYNNTALTKSITSVFSYGNTTVNTSVSIAQAYMIPDNSLDKTIEADEYSNGKSKANPKQMLRIADRLIQGIKNKVI